MAELETPMAFCLRNSATVDGACIGSPFVSLAKLIESRDNAVRLALLKEIHYLRGTWESRIIALRDKYSKAGG